MNILSLAYFSAFAAYLWLAGLVVTKGPKSALNRICALFLVSLGVWCFAYTFKSSAAAPEGARLWDNIASFGWCVFPSLGLWFALVLSGKKNRFTRLAVYPLMLLAPVLLVVQQWRGGLITDYLKIPGGWADVWARGAWAYFFYAYYASFIMACIGLFLWKLSGAKKAGERKQLVLIIVTAVVSFAGGSVTDVLLPALGVMMPSVACLIALVAAGGLAYGITRYGLMANPQSLAAANIISAMTDGLFVIHSDAAILEINDALCEMTGYRKRELIGKPVAVLFNEKDGAYTDFYLTKLVRDGSLKNCSAAFRTKKGGSVPVILSGSVMKDGDGAYIGSACIVRDIREILKLQRREAELVAETAALEKTKVKELEEARMELEKRVDERTRELQDTYLASLNIMEDLDRRKSELEGAYSDLKEAQDRLLQTEKQAAVGRLAGGLAHEINNPMGIILGFAQSVAKKIKEDDPYYLPLKSIEREALRCINLVGDLLTFSRAEKFRSEPADINKLLDEALAMVKPHAADRNIEIVRDYDPGPPGMMLNSSQIQRVVLNLCNNSIDAMPGGGRITVSTRKDGGRVVIGVADTGKGMPEEVKKHVFEPFYTTKEPGKGTGLGLSLCYEIITGHGGTIEVESAEGRGTTVWIRLPSGGAGEG